MKRFIFVLAVTCCLSFSTTSFASIVGTKLSLVIDVSGSISTSEYNLMMGGYEAAFLDATVQSNIALQQHGIAVNVIFFSSSASIGMGWTQMQTGAEVTAFANALGALARDGSIGSLTDIASGMALSNQQFLDNTYTSNRLIMDVSGDGVRNNGGQPSVQRDAAFNAGIKVNGLVIGDSNLLDYYNANVVTSNGFGVQAPDFAAFNAAVLAKLRVETGGAVPEPGTLTIFASMALISVCRVRRRRIG